ncbi:hypothetical protein [Citricoccus sp. NR2]|uniref:hypothetical protein n=1 Tax=Citricoccus sp. NR2 TaxID=3004095 RepID=UPI0022DE617E|nr:hypothetical protein [Citricoccus sp. NR2]WBL20011.1 hypothetical protein O1A05_04820 [Citricoccus sp. NR2]
MSATTALINQHGVKNTVLVALRAELPRGWALTAQGDTWVLRSATGSQRVYLDIDDLLHELFQRWSIPAPAVLQRSSGL